MGVGGTVRVAARIERIIGFFDFTTRSVKKEMDMAQQDTKKVTGAYSSKTSLSKDFINIGIFAAIYVVVFFAISMTGLIPIMMLFYIAIACFFEAVVVMALLTRVRRFGAYTAIVTLMGLVLALSGHGVFALVAAIVFGLVGDFIMSRGQYRSFRLNQIGYAVSCLWSIGAFSNILIDPVGYWATIVPTYGQEYVDTIAPLLSVPVVVGIVLSGAVAGFLGCYLARAILKKHFARAGIV